VTLRRFGWRRDTRYDMRQRNWKIRYIDLGDVRTKFKPFFFLIKKKCGSKKKKKKKNVGGYGTIAPAGGGIVAAPVSPSRTVGHNDDTTSLGRDRTGSGIRPTE